MLEIWTHVRIEMPRSGPSMLYSGSYGMTFLPTTIPISRSSVVPVAISEEESTQFSEVRQTIAGIMSKLIQREKDTGPMLREIAEKRAILKTISNS